MAPKHRKVGGGPLSIMHQVTAISQALLEGAESHLGCLGFPAEHGFAEEGPPDRHPIDATDQPAIAPNFRAVRVAQIMERLVAFQDVIRDPGIPTVGAA